MRTFYVTPTKATCDYTHDSAYTKVHADDVYVGPTGELAFCRNVGENDVFVVVVYAPGTWVAFTESDE